MKAMKLQIQDVSGKVKEEREIKIGKEDTLVIRVPEDASEEDIHMFLEQFSSVLKTGGIVVIPDTVKLEVIKKEG